jgi:hypothetical protein
MKQITIPITDHADNCTAYYNVEYKLSTDIAYNSFKAFTDRVVISNVFDASVYNVRITRYCCNGSSSAPLTLIVDTSTDSPVLVTPTGFSLTPGAAQIAANCDDVTDAETYVWEIATDPLFTAQYQRFETTVSNKTITELTSGTLYHVRVKATASGFADSDYASGTATQS